MLQEQNAIEVVDFVAERAREEVLTANFERFTLHVLCLDGDKLRPHNVPAESGNGETTFFFAHFTFGMSYLGVRKNNFPFRIFSAGHVDYRKAHALSDLRSSQPYALRRVHGSEHVFGKLFEFRVKFFYQRARLFEDRIAVLDDRIDFPWRRRHRWRVRGGGRKCFRSRRLVGHSCRNSAAFLAVSLPQIFAEKYPPTQEQPWLRLRPLRRGPRTNQTA